MTGGRRIPIIATIEQAGCQPYRDLYVLLTLRWEERRLNTVVIYSDKSRNDEALTEIYEYLMI